jgi:hypothetical protein
MTKLVKTKGLTILWRGLGPTLWRDVPFSGTSAIATLVQQEQADTQVYTGQDSRFSKLNSPNPAPTSHHSPHPSYPVLFPGHSPLSSLNLSMSSKLVDKYSHLHPIARLLH